MLTYFAARSSLEAGLGMVFTVGYFYGISRANLDQAAAHLIFDSAVIALYMAQLFKPLPMDLQAKLRELKVWNFLFFTWTLFLFCLPFQDLYIQLVGLRGNIFFFPFLILGARLGAESLKKMAMVLGALNCVAFGFGIYEYFHGISSLYPLNSLTTIIYKSRDIANYSAYRIPATFINASAYSGTMVTTLPLILGGWIAPGLKTWQRVFLSLAFLTTAIGVFLGASRIHFIIFMFLIAVAVLISNIRISYRIGMLLFVGILGSVVLNEDRMQRFKTLNDTELVARRVKGSTSTDIFDLASRYPLGNGLGGGGTSIPYFLMYRLEDPVVEENEYMRICLELGVPGLLLFISFLFWAFSRRFRSVRDDPWKFGRRLAYCCTLAYCGVSLLGIGLMSSIPQTCLFFICLGWISTRPHNHDPDNEMEPATT